MKKIILSTKEKTIELDEFLNQNEWDWGLIVTKVSDDNGDRDGIYFLVGNKPHKFYFSNLCGYSLGTKEYESMEEAIKARIEGTDCACKPSEVYEFENLKEVVEKFGE